MSFLRNLWADLVEKRLWPVAAGLAAALVAVPFLLGGGGTADSSDVVAVPVPKSATVKPTQIRVSEDADVATLAPSGSKHDPFTQPKVKQASTAGDAPTSAPATTHGDSAGGASTASTQGGGAAPSTPTTPPTTSTPSIPTTPSTTTPPDTTTKKPEPDTSVMKVDLRFGEPGRTKQKTYDDIARLSALPSSDEPIVIFLGVEKDKKTAAFLISSDATSTGDGACKPSTTNCQTIEMQAGDTTFLDIDLGSGVRQFRLDVKSISETKAVTTKQAYAARARMSVAGQEYLRSAIESGEVSLSGLDYSEATGTLTSAPRAKTAGPMGRGAYQADVKVGAMLRTDVRRFQLLPQRSTAKVLFLGVLDGGRSAAFLNVGGKAVTGARCRPSRTQCRRFTLTTGKTAFVDGIPVTVTKLTLRRFPTAAAAQAFRAREADAGLALVTKKDLDLGDLALDPATGTLTVSPL